MCYTVINTYTRHVNISKCWVVVALFIFLCSYPFVHTPEPLVLSYLRFWHGWAWIYSVHFWTENKNSCQCSGGGWEERKWLRLSLHVSTMIKHSFKTRQGFLITQKYLFGHNANKNNENKLHNFLKNDNGKFLTFLAEFCNVVSHARIELNFMIQIYSVPESEVPTWQH